MASWNTGTLEEKFNRHWMAEPNSGCWLWHSACDKDGYGLLRHNGKNRRAHRVSYEIHVGPIAHGKFVCHKCDLPSCVNPEHLFLGTNSDNQKDASKKGRHAHQRLSVANVLDIKESIARGATQASMCKKYGVSDGHVSQIISGAKWGHVDIS